MIRHRIWAVAAITVFSASTAAHADDPSAAPTTDAAVPAVATPSAAPTASAAPAEAAASEAKPATPAASADVSSTTVLSAATPPPSDFRAPAGYTKTKKGLETVYCKSYTPIGSRMPEKLCYSEAQIRSMMKQTELDQSLMRQKATAGGTNGG